MASTIVTAPELQDYSQERLEEKLNQWVPNFAQSMDRGAGDLIGNLEAIQEYSLWSRLGYGSMEEYLLERLNHTQEWCDDVIRIYTREWGAARRDSATVGELYSEAEKVRYERDVRIHAMRDQGMTQQEIANAVGKTRWTIYRACSKEPAIAPKMQHPKRTEIKVSISPGSDPLTAAARIRAKLGDEFARRLNQALQEKEDV